MGQGSHGGQKSRTGHKPVNKPRSANAARPPSPCTLCSRSREDQHACSVCLARRASFSTTSACCGRPVQPGSILISSFAHAAELAWPVFEVGIPAAERPWGGPPSAASKTARPPASGILGNVAFQGSAIQYLLMRHLCLLPAYVAFQGSAIQDLFQASPHSSCCPTRAWILQEGWQLCGSSLWAHRTEQCRLFCGTHCCGKFQSAVVRGVGVVAESRHGSCNSRVWRL